MNKVQYIQRIQINDFMCDDRIFFCAQFHFSFFEKEEKVLALKTRTHEQDTQKALIFLFHCTKKNFLVIDFLCEQIGSAFYVIVCLIKPFVHGNAEILNKATGFDNEKFLCHSWLLVW